MASWTGGRAPPRVSTYGFPDKLQKEIRVYCMSTNNHLDEKKQVDVSKIMRSVHAEVKDEARNYLHMGLSKKGEKLGQYTKKYFRLTATEICSYKSDRLAAHGRFRNQWPEHCHGAEPGCALQRTRLLLLRHVVDRHKTSYLLS